MEQWRTWLPELVARYAHTRLLTRRQQLAVWQQLVEDRSAPITLLNSPAVAAWAKDAWTILSRYEIDDPAAFGDSPDLRKLLEWGTAYERLLAERGWADQQSILRHLDRGEIGSVLSSRPRDLVLLDIDEPVPLEKRCLRHLEAAGWTFSQRRLPVLNGNVTVRAADSVAEEIELAMNWLRNRLDENPSQRVALVADNNSILDAIVRRRSGEWPGVAFARGTSPIEIPPIGAALNALEMLGPDGSSLHLSSWLRSPFMQGLQPQSAGASARFELARREVLAAQLPLRRTRNGLLQSLQAAAPHAGDRLMRAFERGERLGSVAPLATWALVWREQLTDLEWLRDSPASVREQALPVIEQAFDSLAALGSVLGAVNGTRALEELRNVLTERLVGSPLPLRGLHVLEHIEDVGPGYAAVWVTGMSQVRWPPRPRGNPLLPRRLVRELRVPWGSREDCFERGAAAVRRVAGASADVVFSFAPGDDEESAQPSTLLRTWLNDDGSRPSALSDTQAGSADTLVSAAADLEIVDESLQRFRGKRLSGGASLLDAQASCPLRAFIDYRLLARPPQPWSRGIPPALRGRILHRAAAHLLEAGIDSAQLSAESGFDWNSRIETAAEHALSTELGDTRIWFAALAAMEHERVRQVLRRLLEVERDRSAFTVEAVETGIVFEVDDFEIGARLDRLDRLESGGLAVIDYKTGRSVARPYWFDDRIADYQLPLYAVAVGESVTAMALCSLGPDTAVYRGYWPESGTFPGTAERRDQSHDWSEQLGQWREEIVTLIREFVAGDAAVYVDARSQLEGLYAPLSRIAEADFAPTEAESS